MAGGFARSLDVLHEDPIIKTARRNILMLTKKIQIHCRLEKFPIQLLALSLDLVFIYFCQYCCFLIRIRQKSKSEQVHDDPEPENCGT
jgi:hypothetical protein